jgi:hypothetical protein
MAGPTASVSPTKVLGGPHTLFGVPRLAALFVRGGEIQEVGGFVSIEKKNQRRFYVRVPVIFCSLFLRYAVLTFII